MMETSFQEKLRSMKNTTFTKSGVDKEWNENVFDEKYKNLKMHLSGLELPEQMALGKIFLNWFVGADMGPNFDLSTTIWKILSLFSNEDHIPLVNTLTRNINQAENKKLSFKIEIEGKIEAVDFSKDVTKTTYFASSGHAIVGTPIGTVMPGIATLSDVEDASQKTTIETVRIFYAACWEILNTALPQNPSNLDALTTHTIYSILNYLAYLSLIISRYSVKSRTSSRRF